MNPSPLRYPGGKYKLYKYVSETMKENSCTTYIEPFCGGSALSLELLYAGIAKKIIINDYDYSIYCFWYSILYYTDNFVKKIIEVNVDINEWHRQKKIRENIDTEDVLSIGFSTFFLNRTNRSGIIDKAGPIGGFQQNGNYKIDCRFNKKNLIDRILKIAERRYDILVYNMEALTFIDEVILKTRKSFTFFDPPYYNKGPGLYTNFYCHGDHENLAKYIQNKLKNRKWIVSYDNVHEVKNMYRGTTQFEFSLNYSLQTKKSGSEVMFLSKNIVRSKEESDLIDITAISN